MTIPELKEQVSKLLFEQSTMEHDWDSRNEWVKEMYRKQADRIFDLITQSGWDIKPKDQK